MKILTRWWVRIWWWWRCTCGTGIFCVYVQMICKNLFSNYSLVWNFLFLNDDANIEKYSISSYLLYARILITCVLWPKTNFFRFEHFDSFAPFSSNKFHFTCKIFTACSHSTIMYLFLESRVINTYELDFGEARGIIWRDLYFVSRFTNTCTVKC